MTPLLIQFSKKEYPGLKKDLDELWQHLSHTSDRDWRAFNGSRYRAEKALKNYLIE